MREAMMTAVMEAAEPAMADFQNKIISDTHYPILCVRIPRLRKLAKEAAKGDWRQLLKEARYESFEETLLVGLTVAYAKVPFAEKADALRQLLPRFDSWALTDSVIPTLKLKPEELPAAWEFAGECLASPLEYTVRFGLVMMLDYFLLPPYVPEVVQRVTALRDERYYVRMAAAWLLAEMAVHEPERVLNLLRQGSLDTFTHNMTIRKMRESYRISMEDKTAAAGLRRKDERK